MPGINADIAPFVATPVGVTSLAIDFSIPCRMLRGTLRQIIFSGGCNTRHPWILLRHTKTMLTWEEREILAYLKTAPKCYFSLREISRRAAGKKVYEEKPNWAKPFLPRMVEKELIEKDSAGHFRYRNQEEVKAKGRKWVSPQIARALKRSDKDFSEAVTLEITDADVE